MTETQETNGTGAGELVDELPLIVECSTAFAGRLPSQRVLDAISSQEIAQFGELAQTQPFRITAFRVLLRDFPDREPAELWRHAYDVEVEVVDADPFGGMSPTLGRSSATTGT